MQWFLNFFWRHHRQRIHGKKRFLGRSIHCMSDVNVVRKRAGTVLSDSINYGLSSELNCHTVYISRTVHCFILITIDGDRGGAFFAVVISKHVHILCLLPLKFDTRFFPCLPKEIMPSSLMLIMETDNVKMVNSTCLVGKMGLNI
jgi:hypothetical protein